VAALAVVAAVAWPHCSAVGAEGQWQRHTIDDSSRGADGARLADVNGDGLMDIAVPWEEGGVVRVYLHPGHDRARERWPAVTVGTVGSPEDAVLADLDRDGAADVVSSCEGKTRAIHIHWAPREPGRYLEPEAWRTEAIPAVRGLAQWMVALPLEIDGRDGLDMVVGARGEGAAVGWLQAPPDARDVAAWKYHPLRASGWIMSLEAADMDADGDLDVLLSDRKGRGRGVFWLENPGPEAAGRGAAWREHEVARGLGEVMFLTTADLLPGGQREIVAAVRGGPLALLLPAGDEAGTWERLEIAMLDSAGTGKAVAAGDLDGDARCDLALTCEGAGGGKSGVWWLSRSRGKNTFYFRQHDVSGRAGTKFDRVELLDLDGDGDLDILTCEETENLGVVWYENPLPPPVAPQDRPATTLALFLAAGATASAPADFVLAPLTFVIVFYSMPLWRQVLDEPPPRVEDLTGYRRPVPDADNGFAAAAVPDDLLSWPEDDEPVQGVSLTFDRREAAALLARHAEALRRLEASLASPEFQAPEAVSHMDLVDYFLSWRERRGVRGGAGPRPLRPPDRGLPGIHDPLPCRPSGEIDRHPDARRVPAANDPGAGGVAAIPGRPGGLPGKPAGNPRCAVRRVRDPDFGPRGDGGRKA
jgi:hypothetical protein